MRHSFCRCQINWENKRYDSSLLGLCVCAHVCVCVYAQKRQRRRRDMSRLLQWNILEAVIFRGFVFRRQKLASFLVCGLPFTHFAIWDTGQKLYGKAWTDFSSVGKIVKVMMRVIFFGKLKVRLKLWSLDHQSLIFWIRLTCCVFFLWRIVNFMLFCWVIVDKVPALHVRCVFFCFAFF